MSPSAGAYAQEASPAAPPAPLLRYCGFSLSPARVPPEARRLLRQRHRAAQQP